VATSGGVGARSAVPIGVRRSAKLGSRAGGRLVREPCGAPTEPRAPERDGGSRAHAAHAEAVPARRRV
jgi:hypothetical protein